VIDEADIPGAGLAPESLYDPVTWEHDEETGWPLGDDGNPAMPIDEFGIAYTPETRWEKRLEELEDETGSAAVAYARYTREREIENARIATQVRSAYEKVRAYQFQKIRPVEGEISQRLGRQYEEPVAREMANRIIGASVRAFDMMAADGRLTKAQVKDPATLRLISDQLQYEIWN
jgi:hypothetical protein